MKFIEIYIPKAWNLEVYSISDLSWAEASSLFLEVQQSSLIMKAVICGKALQAVHVPGAQESCAIRSTAAEL